MTKTVATLGEQALRRLGVAIVPVAQRPALTAIIPPATIATNALVELGVIASDETPSTADQALALAKVLAMHDGLVAQAVVSWTSDQIMQAVSEEYTKLAALFMASSFGKQADPQLVPMLEARIRKVSVIMGSYALASDAVLSVHDDLAARGLVRWTTQDVPDAVGYAYSELAAIQLAPQFAVQADPRMGMAALRSIAQYIALTTSGENVKVEYF